MAQPPAGKLYDLFAPPERLTLLLEAMARGDEAEAGRLRGSCPRRTYTGPDVEFDERLSLAFNTLAVVCIDLRGMWGKLHVLHWAMASARRFATLHHINADFAFLDGARCARGIPQLEFFARPPRPLPEAAGGGENDGEDDDEDEDEDDDNDGAAAAADDDDRADRGDSGLSALGENYPRRMAAIEDRAEHASGMIALVLARAAAGVAQDLVDVWDAFGRFCRGRVGVSPRTMLNAWGPPADDFEQALACYPKLRPTGAKSEEYFALICAAWDRRFGIGQEGGGHGG